MYFKKRTHTCGELTLKDVDKSVVLNGWVDSRRDLGGVIFIRLRDRYGITQIVFEPEENKKAHQLGKELRNEFVISAEGIVRKRPEEQVDKDSKTGSVDVIVNNLEILSEAETPPFPIKDRVEAFDDLRLKYRYLDLRRPVLQRIHELRHKMYQAVRKYFDKNSFWEIETPVLMKSTPEGARDYLVPSRLHKGKFYALPQSPQQYKQLLMVSGFDRYFQIVKCFRDEDLRADRQPEFTQIDVEMSFVDEEDVFKTVEGLMQNLYKEIWEKKLESPVPRFSFEEAMEKYGSDKPDLRFDMELITLHKVVQNSEFKVFNDACKNGIVTGIVAKGCSDYSRNQIDNLTSFVKEHGAKGLVWFKVTNDGLNSPVAKFLSEEKKADIVKAVNAEIGDLILVLAGDKLETLNQQGALRLEMARRLDLIKPDSEPSLVWITDFPLLEWDEDTGRYYAMHHPFTSPRLEDIDLLESDPGKAKARAYDLVLNGNEIAGGSIRIHNPDLQSKMFKILGVPPGEAEQKFGFLMNAFKYGAPPHGGIAFGFDRMVMIFSGNTSIRDTIAFPKTTSALSLMDESPSSVSEEQLRDLHIKIK